MERYVFTAEKRAALENLRQPYAVYQFIDKRVVTILLSDGFCDLFGYTDREKAVFDMDHDMYKDTHPDDVARIADATVHFATQGGRYEVIYRIEDVPVSAACDRAKLACKALGGSYISGFRYYSTELREDTLMKQYVIENFDTALQEKWIQVYLQPIVRSINGKVCDVEALSRWVDPEKGVLSPAKFIPTLEEAGLIYKLDLYMLDRVLESIRMQKANGFAGVPHSINLSRSDFDVCDMVEEIRMRVDGAGVKRDRITVEITRRELFYREDNDRILFILLR